MKYGYILKGLKLNFELVHQGEPASVKGSMEVEELQLTHEVEGGIKEQAEYMVAVGKAAIGLIGEIRQLNKEQKQQERRLPDVEAEISAAAGPVSSP
jgi:hypothetical protein